MLHTIDWKGGTCDVCNNVYPHRENEFLFLPGVSCREEVGFVMGQFIEQDGSTGFVKGQVIAFLTSVQESEFSLLR